MDGSDRVTRRKFAKSTVRFRICLYLRRYQCQVVERETHVDSVVTYPKSPTSHLCVWSREGLVGVRRKYGAQVVDSLPSRPPVRSRTRGRSKDGS